MSSYVANMLVDFDINILINNAMQHDLFGSIHDLDLG